MPKEYQQRLFSPGAPGNAGGIGPVKIVEEGEAGGYGYSFGVGKRNPKIVNRSLGWERYVDVIWRRLRTEKEARHADTTYARLQAMRKIHPTTKTVARIEPRPYASEALKKCQQKLVEVWKDSLK